MNFRGSSNRRAVHYYRHIALRARLAKSEIPEELEQLQGFPKGWTNTGMTDGNRAFCMGNALVVGIPHLIGMEIAKEIGKSED